ncbi:adenylate cyclase [Chitinivibrio alkaliphilus]|uniref:Adenylate cyclase n=1 Tax=Chitinivibrio alkaliphilus ACht1 TaxID=1313304 RepID=U7D7X4_9BACT|nr:adenylate cyclase [Chitinivibrio alkaliphilus]ERP31192.1 Adenylate cyclase [Chitinivibrio alkaliphilus ACht1]
MVHTQEIERQFLVKKLPDNLSQYPYTDIKQGYLSIEDDREVRLRQAGTVFTLTVKQGQGEVREEEEILLKEKDFTLLWRLTEGRRVVKRRYHLPYTHLQLELDIYYEELNGFYSVEVEFENRASSAAFVPPAWFGREVTHDERYKNKHICNGRIRQ